MSDVVLFVVLLLGARGVARRVQQRAVLNRPRLEVLIDRERRERAAVRLLTAPPCKVCGVDHCQEVLR